MMKVLPLFIAVAYIGFFDLAIQRHEDARKTWSRP